MYQKYRPRLVRENDLIVLENLRLANMSRRNKPVPDPLHEADICQRAGRETRTQPEPETGEHGTTRVHARYRPDWPKAWA